MVFCVLSPQRIFSEVGEGGTFAWWSLMQTLSPGRRHCSTDQCPRRPCRQGSACCCFLSKYKLLLEVARFVSLKNQIPFCRWWQGRALLSYKGWSKSLTRPGGASSLEKGIPRWPAWPAQRVAILLGPRWWINHQLPAFELLEVELAACCAEWAPGRPVTPVQVPRSSQSEEASLQPPGTLELLFWWSDLMLPGAPNFQKPVSFRT